ncbi:MAG: SH3 domain-containing protein [Oscillospiraceae bacterium]|nr:SH3 domain-containing protein [Oscillospiraceae bacterium]
MKFYKKLIPIIIAIAIAVSLVPFSASAATTIAYGAATVNTTNLNLRSGPGTSYSVLTKLNTGDIVVVLECTNSEWYKINFHGTIGYVAAAYLDNVLTVENFSAIGCIVGDRVNVRSQPSTDSEKLTTYDEDSVITVIGINEGWYKIKQDGYTGYVRSDFMVIISGTRASSNVYYGPGGSGSSNSSGSSASAGSSGSSTSYAPAPSANLTLGQQIAEYALSFLGSKYVWGGTSPSGFDCSGLVTYVYKHFGISVSRVADAQYKNNGVSVSKSQLSPGDLVFFSPGGTGTVSHVGIYIGDNEFVHASSSTTGVIVSRLDSTYYVKNWHGAKRLI